eukprot:6689927-Pyramimonas_sp.AAC.1
MSHEKYYLGERERESDAEPNKGWVGTTRSVRTAETVATGGVPSVSPPFMVTVPSMSPPFMIIVTSASPSTPTTAATYA